MNRIRPAAAAFRLHNFCETMRTYTFKEKAKITAGAVTALIIVAWLTVIAIALLSA